MFKSLSDWLDHRTGYRGILRGALYENIPGGARWRYVWGSTLVFTFAVQMITGFFLWMAYSPSSTTAWESVYYIQNKMWGGWLLRGIHHYTAQAMVVLIALHMLQVILDGAYRAPREVNFWIGLILLQIVLGLSLTGYLLPWDQKGYWATQVATNIAASIPGIGSGFQRVIVGGEQYGHHTLTRFFALHAGLLPFLMMVFTAFHLYVFRRHGIHAKEPQKGPNQPFWVDQVLKDAVACLAVLMVVLILCLKPALKHGFGDTGLLGAELGAPAEPSESYGAARPEWYFLFLFQFLKLPWFKGENEFLGAVVIPGAVMLLLFLMPLIGKWKLGHRFNVALIIALFLGAGVLTAAALVEDLRKPDYKTAVAQAGRDADRARQLATDGIPPSGAITLLRSDPYTQGPRIFAQHCASCHRYDGHDGLGTKPDTANASNPSPQSAPDLKGFATREWIAGLMDAKQIDTPKYFGGTKFKGGGMSEFVRDEVAKADADGKAEIDKIIKALSAEAKLKSQAGKDQDPADAAAIAEGRKLISQSDDFECTQCHKFDGAGKTKGPDLTGYGSREWMIEFVKNPSHKRFYGERNDRMPLFGEKQLLTDQQIGMVVDWLRGDWYTPGGSAPATMANISSPAGTQATPSTTRQSTTTAATQPRGGG
jgi:ubiquinol-cytochrome c reductase cytochrome b subunit